MGILCQECRCCVAGAVLLMLHPIAVAAQGFVSPAVGTSFGAAVGDFKFEPKVNVGVVTGWLGPGVIGFEVDINHTADLYTIRDPSMTRLGIQIARDSRFTSVMGNVVFHTPRSSGGASLRPYASGGVGLTATKIDGPFPYADAFDVNLKDPAINVGGGAMYFFGRHLGIRADIRYINVISKRSERVGGSTHFTVNDLALWRATLGAAFQFH